MSIAGGLLDGLDVAELLSGMAQTCAQLLDVSSAGLLLADERGTLHGVAASTESTKELQLLQLQREQGPCLDCFRTGSPVSAGDLRAYSPRWPLFVHAARTLGVNSVHAVPLRLRDQVLGTLGLFGSGTGRLNDDDLHLAQALAQVASVALFRNKALADRAAVSAQLQNALTSRVVLEQAKGVLAQQGDLDMEQAFAELRRYARNHNRRLTDVARAVVAGELPATALLGQVR